MRGCEEINDHPTPHDRRRTNNSAAGVSPRPRSHVKPRPLRHGLASKVLPTSVSVIHLDARLAHSALRQSGKRKSYEDLDDPSTTAQFEILSQPLKLPGLDRTVPAGCL